MYRLVLVLMLTGCGSSYTYGDLAKNFSQGYCEARSWCGLLSGDLVDRCVDHLMYHLCGADETCDKRVEDEAQDDLVVCLEALKPPPPDEPTPYCDMFYWGVIPAECVATLDWFS